MRMVKRATSFFNSFCTNVANKLHVFVARFTEALAAKAMRTVKKKTTIGLISIITTLHVQHTFFVHFLAVVSLDYNAKQGCPYTEP